MILAFQIVLLVLVLFFSLGMWSNEPVENRRHYLSIVLAGIAALSVSFWVG